MRPSHKRAAELFSYEPDTGKLFRKVGASSNAKAWSEVGWINGDGYLCVMVDRRHCKVHQIVWLLVHGSWPSGVIDHINRNKTDNRASNLRDTTVQANNINVGPRRNNKTGIKNVTWRERDQLFYASCTRNGRCHYIGSFKSADAASRAVEAFTTELGRKS